MHVRIQTVKQFTANTAQRDGVTAMVVSYRSRTG